MLLSFAGVLRTSGFVRVRCCSTGPPPQTKPLNAMAWKARPPRFYFTIAGGIILLDQAVKILVKLTMGTQEPANTIHVLGDFFKIYFIENKGAAFGLTFASFFGGLDDTTAKLLLTLFSLALAGFIAYYLIKVAQYPTRLPLLIAMILGGALGNIIDRVFYGVWFAEINDYEGGLLHGRVVDMFYIDIWKGYVPESWPILGGDYMTLWPVFNVADMAIFFGIGFILIFQRRLFKPIEEAKEKEKPQEAEATPNQAATGQEEANSDAS